ncbi:ABC transporter ATP-binding protein [Bradyrhizobium sp. LHD-71]|uniref:ABC transporter ATP-binding protein n=1 Tax=Bradyrhizobium sp. LHD-71 TaxID=3072141 RepID=UPI00280FB254|nr:ABC transporter ATP-binding protein [Bradyrhizobium sp. LHD-71]MDQ8726836.1 ABC transporter ATP-binding protein [Bradyrhizobium sp. LHD-71]
MTAVSLTGITKAFKTTPVLRGVNLTVNGGEFLAIVGPSGCGKSTLLRIVAGLEEHDGGEVRIGGAVVDELPPGARDIAMVFQSYALYPHMTVRENIALPLAMRDLSRVERLPLTRYLSRRVADRRLKIRAAVADAAALVALDGLLDRKPKELSGGQRQRVALARALVRRPQLFLLDEPLSNLDAALRTTTRAEIVELQRRLGIATIYVTHDQAEAMTMADRIAVMMEGAVVQVGTAKCLYDTPADIRVAQFIGTPQMNFLPAIVARGAVRVAGLQAPIGLAPTAADGSARLGIRAEHLRLAIHGRGWLAGTVRHHEFLGAEQLIHVVADGIAAPPMLVRAASDDPLPPSGTRVGLIPAWHRMHLFDASGRRHEIEAAESTATQAGSRSLWATS